MSVGSVPVLEKKSETLREMTEHEAHPRHVNNIFLRFKMIQPLRQNRAAKLILPRDFPCDLPPFTWPDKRRYMPGDPSQNESLLLGRPHPSVDATAHLPTDQEITIRVVPSGCPFRLSLPAVPSVIPSLLSALRHARENHVFFLLIMNL